MSENTVSQIKTDTPDEFSEIREDVPSGLLDTLARALGISPAKIANVLGAALPGKSKLNATCPNCGNRYKYFSDEAYQEDQSTCPPCRDEAMAAQREAAMRPEKIEAAKRLREQEAVTAAKKNDERQELVTLVAETVAQLQKTNA